MSKLESGRKGWNAFFDYPPDHPQGTTAFFGTFGLDAIQVKTVGSRLRVRCEGFEAGPFAGALEYTFFPRTRLIQQQAVVTTNEPNVAYFYDAGIEFSAPEQTQIGRNMLTPLVYYDTEGRLREQTVNRAPARAGPLQGPVSSTGDYSWAGKHRRISGTAPVFFPARLYIQSVPELAPFLARARGPRHPPDPRYQLAILSVGERSPRE